MPKFLLSFFFLEPFTTPDDETQFTYPIGAPIRWIFTHNDNVLDGSGSIVIGFRFIPVSHLPLQEPAISITLNSQGISAVVEYDAASPSLSGAYVLCSLTDTPLLCGGRISLTVIGMYINYLVKCAGDEFRYRSLVGKVENGVGKE